MKTYAYGFPRLGKNREFKKHVEAFFKGDASEQDTFNALNQCQSSMTKAYRSKNIDTFPFAEITAYDQLLDMAIMVGLYSPQDLKEHYTLCRGANALEMTKWFNTNYHFLVPDFEQIGTPTFALNKVILRDYLDASLDGIPFFIGPFTLLKLSKNIPSGEFASYLTQVSAVYAEAIQDLGEVHIEEPGLVLDLTDEEVALFKEVYTTLGQANDQINLITYYDSVDALTELYDLPVKAIGLDFVHGQKNLGAIKEHGFPKDKTLIAGVINGRNVLAADMAHAQAIVNELKRVTDNVVLSNSSPLYHLPISLEGESKLDTAFLNHLAFAEEKLDELNRLARIIEKDELLSADDAVAFGRNQAIVDRVYALKDDDFVKSVGVDDRRALQDKTLELPLFPTTTIGSFPQTREVRKARADYRKGNITAEEYDAFIKTSIEELIAFQEKVGLDVLVHGEYERTDMVEFFAEKLDGIATTENGWIISYGTRGYRPPIVFGDVSRPEAMTVKEIAYAQSLTNKPVKGMLTGPVTILAWSFVREDIPIEQVAYQLGLALQDEIRDYEEAGIQIVQVDEPAFREKAPIKQRDWQHYFEWAIKSFRLTTNTRPSTQIHSHMCYSEFNAIVDHIDAMNFDVISIESARSRGEMVEAFEQVDFEKQIGLGVWDIHSPVVPSVDQMQDVVTRALQVIPAKNFWINPDCGLKTRDWPEVEAALSNLVAATARLRD